MTAITDNEGTELTGSTVNTNYSVYNTTFTNFILEFDLVNINSDWCRINLYTTKDNLIPLQSNGAKNGSHIFISYDGSNITLKIDNNTPITIPLSISTHNISFFIGNSPSERKIKYKNLIIYKYLNM